MTPKKPRKHLDDSLADVFVYGTSAPTPKPVDPQLSQDAQSPAQSQELTKPPNKSRVMEKLMSDPVQKEPNC
jgi:hypothetical protein